MTIPIRKVLDDARSLLGQHPELGHTVTVARADLVGQVGTEVRVGRHLFSTDEPEAAGGNATAPTPVELALGAIAACQAVTYRYWSELLDIPFDTVAVQVRGEGDAQGFLGFGPSAPPALGRIDVTAEIQGPRPADQYRELHDAVEAHCPLLLAFGEGIPVNSQLVVH